MKLVSSFSPSQPAYGDSRDPTCLVSDDYVLDELGIDNSIVCANINRIGFRMSGGIELYAKTIGTRRFRLVAMSVLASGAISPREEIQCVCAWPRIDSIVFGASSCANLRQTQASIDELSAPVAA